MEKVSIITLGCKTNAYEGQSLGEVLESEGYDVCYSTEKADIYILNTCAVTNEAERKSRQYISKLTKLNPKCKIFVCGCASQNNPEQFKTAANVHYVTGNANRMYLLEKITARKGGSLGKLPKDYEDLQISKPVQARTYVKIQDGCNRFCSYCLIPYLRGRSRSRNIISILKELDALVKAGAKEVVLTGIDISDYQIDEKPALLELLEQVNSFGVRFRMGSFEPNILTEEFVKKLKTFQNFCPHFHISMQSGSTRVLDRMNRKYTAEFFIERVKLIRKHFKNPAITTDLIVGFPGETDEEFLETLNTIKRVKFAEMHIFPYSRRTGTAADKMLNIKNSGFCLVDPKTIKQRVKTAIALANKYREKYLKTQKHKTLDVVIEQTHENFLVGTSQNYMKVYIESNCNKLINSLQKVKILKPFKDGLLGEIIN